MFVFDFFVSLEDENRHQAQQITELKEALRESQTNFSAVTSDNQLLRQSIDEVERDSQSRLQQNSQRFKEQLNSIKVRESENETKEVIYDIHAQLVRIARNDQKEENQALRARIEELQMSLVFAEQDKNAANAESQSLADQLSAAESELMHYKGLCKEMKVDL